MKVFPEPPALWQSSDPTQARGALDCEVNEAWTPVPLPGAHRCAFTAIVSKCVRGKYLMSYRTRLHSQLPLHHTPSYFGWQQDCDGVRGVWWRGSCLRECDYFGVSWTMGFRVTSVNSLLLSGPLNTQLKPQPPCCAAGARSKWAIEDKQGLPHPLARRCEKRSLSDFVLIHSWAKQSISSTRNILGNAVNATECSYKPSGRFSFFCGNGTHQSSCVWRARASVSTLSRYLFSAPCPLQLCPSRFRGPLAGSLGLTTSGLHGEPSPARRSGLAALSPVSNSKHISVDLGWEGTVVFLFSLYKKVL